jgi:hypothetical protein
MHPELTRQLAEQHIAELHRQAATRRLIRDLRTRPGPVGSRRRTLWDRLLLRQPRPTAAILAKLGVANRGEAAAVAHRLHLIR